jgi:hypothetical protein
VYLEADITPGTSPGLATFGGNVHFGPLANLKIELGGLEAGTQFDQLIIAGNAILDGTLEVSLINGFIPSVGQSFNLFDWGGLAGTFSSLALPALSGVTWDASQLYTTGAISVAAAPILLGDYNSNGTVDAADYVLWRKYNNTATTLPNDSTPGTNQSDYDVWRAHFGQTAGSGSNSDGTSSPAAVPEPSTVLIFAWGLFFTKLGNANSRLTIALRAVK